MAEVSKSPRRPSVIAVEEDDDPVHEHGYDEGGDKVDDVIPGPTTSTQILANLAMDLSRSDKLRKGNGMLASPEDLNMPADVFAQGCMLLQQAALGNKAGMEAILVKNPQLVNFRDYDRRTALHVACSDALLQL